MLSTKLGLYALTLELAALAGIALGETGDSVLLFYLGAHAVAGALLAAFIHPLLPRHLAQPRLPILALIFGIGYAVPVLGFIGVAAGVIALRLLPAYQPPDHFRAVDMPEIDPHQRAGSGVRQTALRSFLGNSRAPEGTRMRALVALQNVSGRISVPLLRDVLADPCEDIRLLAYGMLDNSEKRLNDQIHRERTHLAQAIAAQNEVERLAATRRLADLYWELVYQELVQGDLRIHALQQSLHYSQEALGHDESDAARWLRLGRLHQLLGDGDAAEADFRRALELGLPKTRIVPYLAELAYDRRDFAAVRAAMKDLHGWQSLPRLQPVVRFWAGS